MFGDIANLSGLRVGEHVGPVIDVPDEVELQRDELHDAVHLRAELARRLVRLRRSHA